MGLRLSKIEHSVPSVTEAYCCFDGDDPIGEIYHTNDLEWCGVLFVTGAEPERYRYSSRGALWHQLMNEYRRLKGV